MQRVGAALLLFAVIGCGGANADDDDDHTGDASVQIDAPVASDDGSIDGALSVDGASPFACGAAICGADEVCVHPCNCGVLSCEPIPDSGMCPEGLYVDYCPGSGEEMCVGCPPPPPPVCRPRPSGCDSELTCDCIETDPCNEWGACGIADGHDIECLCA